MGRRRKYLICALVAIATSAVSCIKNDDTIEFRQRPTMVLDFRYLNRDSINTVNKEVEHIDVIIYSPLDSLFATYYIKKSELLAHAGVVPLYGVPEGDYKVVSVGNRTNIKIVPTKSVLTDGAIRYNSTTMNNGCDSIFMSLDTIKVERGRPYPPTTKIDLYKKFYILEMEITGAKYLNRPKDNFWVQVVGVPNGFDFRGLFADDYIIVKPPLNINIGEDIMTTTLALNEFSYKNDVIIEIFDRQERIGSLDLKKKILSENIDLSQKDQSFKVKVNITTIGSSIVVKDWDMQPVQGEDLGN